MADLADRIEPNRDHVTPRWTKERERRVWQGVERRTASTGRSPWWALVVAAIAALLFVATRPGAPVAERPAPRGETSPTLRLADGTEVASLTADARVEAVDAAPGVTALRLVSGAARFDVAHVDGRVFRVLAGDTVVQVLGTRFVVRSKPGGAEVTVERGRVRVSWPGGDRVLDRGQSLSTVEVARAAAKPGVVGRRDPADGVAEPEPEPEPAEVAEVAPRRAEALAAVPSWKQLAREGAYAAALERLAADESSPRDDPEELLLAADVARLGGEPSRAVGWLRTAVDDHPTDSRAPLAAFTLGRTLEQLGRSSEAARAFARARALAPGGSLAEDALAREVECWARAGEATRARRRADAYLRAYPDGRRRRAVLQHASGVPPSP